MEAEDDDTGPPRGPIVALVVVALLVAGGLYLAHRINAMSTLQDCVASGRTNCAPVATGQ